MGDNLVWQTTEDPAEAEVAVVYAGLRAHNAPYLATGEIRPLKCFVRLPSGGVIGGALAETWGGRCSLDILWVDEAHRGRGIGAELVRQMETAALERGCTVMMLNTFSFQAPSLYERLGYREVCRFEGYPHGIAKHFYEKRLDEENLDEEPSDG